MANSGQTRNGKSLENWLTEQFYQWEIWGRGWRVWNDPVELEPPFYPFFGHFAPGGNEVVDDGRKPTMFSKFTNRLHHLLRPQPPTQTPPYPPDEREPYPFANREPLKEIQVILPAEGKVTKDASEQLLLSIGKVSQPIAFEIAGNHSNISLQFTCSGKDESQLRTQLSAWFPEAFIVERPLFLASLFDKAKGEVVVVDYGLANEFMRPLRRFDKFDPDPLTGFVGAMQELATEEVVVFQVLFVPVLNPWPESILRAVTDGQGGSFFVDDASMVSLAGEKIASPLFATVIRVGAKGATLDRARRIADRVAMPLQQLTDPASNHLIPLTNREYDHGTHARDLLDRQSRRCGMLLNADELLSLVHLPSQSVRSDRLEREHQRTRAAPSLAIGNQLRLGENRHAGRTIPITLAADQRVRHTYVIGASGTGKSTLLLQMIVQDIQNGDGIAVLDPHGDLIESILPYIPEKRAADVILLDPSDEQYPVGFNILSAHSHLESNLLSSDLVSVFQRLSTSWGDQMTSVLGNAVLAFLESSEGGTLADLRRFLVEADFREQFLATVRDEQVVYYWRKEFPLLSGRPQASILTRLDTFLRPKLIRQMVSQKKDLDCSALMNDGKILLAKLAQGLIGEENSYLLGTLLVSRLNQAAMSRQAIAATLRKPFYLYIDEFHNFITPSMAAILAGARKYNLGLVLAHQESQQLHSRSRDLASAVLSNPYTRVCFRLGDTDAKKMEDGFTHFTAKDLQNLGLGEAICRIERSEYDFNLKTEPLPPIEPELAAHRRATILSSSRSQYGMSAEATPSAKSQEKPASDDRVEPAETKPGTKVSAHRALAREGCSTKRGTADAPTSPGRGGQQHKYLQGLVKRWAEERGYEVGIEKSILGGLGSVDVALCKGSATIACEISVTTSVEHEIGNIQKCLAAGYQHVLAISSEPGQLARLRAAVETALSTDQLRQVEFFTPERVFTFLESLEAKRPTPTTATAHASKDLLTAKELEELLRIDAKTIYSYVQRGLIPYVRIQSNLRFVKADVMAWLAERQFKPRGARSGKNRQ